MSIPFGLRGKLLLPVLFICSFMTISIHYVWEPNMVKQKRTALIEKEKDSLQSIAPGLIQMLLAGDMAAIYSTLDRVLAINKKTWKAIEFKDEEHRRLYPIDPVETVVIGKNIGLEHRLMLDDEYIGNLFLIVGISRTLTKEHERVHEFSLIILFFFVLLVATSLFWQYYLICNPLIRLRSAASKLARGDFDVQLPKISNDEVGQLTQAFKIMRDNLVDYISKRNVAEKSLQHTYDKVEQQVAERTRELQTVNKTLTQEIYKHHLARNLLRLKEMVFRNTSEAIVITNISGEIVELNDAYCYITGYSKAEVLGKNPSSFKSGRHDKIFYQEMWRALTEMGCWRGEIWDRRKNGEVYPKFLTINAVENEELETTHYVGIFSDISEMKATEEQLEKLAYYDPLTGLPNRMLFKDRLSYGITMAKRNQTKIALLFMDLDHFKDVNDSMGHQLGDELLQQVANRIQKCVREADTVARMGGDEFTVILCCQDNDKAASIVAQDIIKKLHEAFMLSGHEVFIGVSIGVATYPTDGETLEILVKHADTAMYRAKEQGRGLIEHYRPELNKVVEKRMQLADNLRQGLKNKQFIIHYQPKFSVVSKDIVCMEALLRWHKGNGMIVYPNDFIPAAEESGLIVPLGRWVLEQACMDAKQWVDKGNKNLNVAVNLSAVQFSRDDIVAMVKQTLQKTGLCPDNLELEITETVILEDEEKATLALEEFSRMGIHISMDDFGTGYSSLAYLRKLPIETIKIDKSFIHDLTTNENDAAIVSAIISLAHDLKINVLAEGVELDEQFNFLKKKHCHEIQGFLLSKPMLFDEVLKLLEHKPKNRS